MNLYIKPHQVIIAWLLFLASSGIMAQNCNIGDRANDLISGRKCAPVNVDWLITYRGVNDGGTGNVIFVFDWADGTPIERIPATLTNATTREWKASLTHVYPKKVGFCNYNPNVTIEVNGELCTSSRQYQTVTVWDTDEFNGGEMAIDPQVFPICVGNDGSVTFGDASQWNCTPPIENDIPNETKRWTQWVYGTDGNITTALIGGIIRPWPFYGNIIPTTEPIWAPQPPGDTSLPIYIPNGYAVGDFFEVTLRNWNYCNPYDDPEIPGTPVDAINGDHPPVITTAIALIVPYPDATIAPVLPMCVNAAAFTLTAVTPNGRWSGPGIENTFTGRFNPTLAGPGTHTIKYRVGNAYGCMGESTTNITVHDIPTALPTAGLSTFLCPGVSTIINGNPSGGMPPYTSHNWSGATTPLIPTNVQSPTFMTVVLGTYNLVYEVTDSRNCRNSATITMLVSPVDISLANPVLNVCTNTTIPLEPKPEGGSQIFIDHLWTGARTDLLSATNVENPYFTSPTTGTFDYDYYVRSDQGCDATVPLQVIVHEYPVADAGSDNQVCGLSYTMAAIPTVGLGSWETISSPGTVTWGDITDGTSTIAVTDYGDYVFRWTEDNNSCTSSDEVSITFLETPTPTVMPDAVVCGLTHTLTAYPHNGLGGWQQTSGLATAVIASPTTAVSDVSVPSAGVYQFTWEENNAICTGSATVQITFNPQAQAIVAPVPPPNCSPAEISFVNNSTNGDLYLWDFGDGNTSTAQNPTHTFENYTSTIRTYAVTLAVENSYGCNNTLIFNIDVSPSPNAKFSYTPTRGCSPLTSTFTNLSSGATAYEWDFDDATPLETTQHAVHQFVNAYNYTVSHEVALVVSNSFGCTDTMRNFVTVYPLPDASFTATPLSGCEPLLVDLLAMPGATTYNWDYGDGTLVSGTMATSQLYMANGNTNAMYDIRLSVTSSQGCVATSQQQITVFPSPQAVLLPDQTSGCAPFDVTFQNLSSGATRAWWITQSGGRTEMSPAASFVYRFDNTSFNQQWQWVKLVVESANGCRDSVEQNTMVYPRVGASISPGTPGCSPHFITFENYTTGGQSFVWDFGDGMSSSSFFATHTFENTDWTDKTMNVTMTATSTHGCVDAATTTVTVYASPVAAFTWTPLELQMPQTTFDFINQTEGNMWNHTWNFGDNTTASTRDAQHTYATSGTYAVTLSVQSPQGCASTVIHPVRITPTVPFLDYGPPASGCVPLQVDFYNLSSPADEFLWEFGDNTSSTVREPSHVYDRPGIYRVKLTAIGEGGTSSADNVVIVVHERPVALFDLNPTVVTIPDHPVNFRDLSTGNIATWLWDFGDSNRASVQNPQHLYTQPGSYTVTLTVTTPNDCQDDYILNAAVTALEGGKIKFPNAFTPSETGPIGGVYTERDPSNTVFFPFTKEGVVEYKLQIFNRWGELLFESNDVTIGWDGYYKGTLSRQDVYIWKAVVKFSNGTVETFSGDVTLLR